MSINLETNIVAICSAFNISYAKMKEEYFGMTIDEIMECEKQQGNSLAEKFKSDILNQPEKLVEFIQLDNPSNKFAILSNLNENDLQEMLPYLQTEDMVLGLSFFTKESLVNMIAFLPNEQAAMLSLDMFSPAHLMSLMPVEAMDEVLAKKELKEMKNLEMQSVAILPPEIKAQMIEAVTGNIPAGVQDVNLAGEVQFDDKLLMEEITSFDKDSFQEALFAIPPGFKQNFLLSMTQEKPEIWGMFNPIYFAQIINDKKDKGDIINSANVIHHEQLVSMSSNLPKDLMSVVLTQIESKVFAKELQKKFSNVIGEMAVS